MAVNQFFLPCNTVLDFRTQNAMLYNGCKRYSLDQENVLVELYIRLSSSVLRFSTNSSIMNSIMLVLPYLELLGRMMWQKSFIETKRYSQLFVHCYFCCLIICSEAHISSSNFISISRSQFACSRFAFLSKIRSVGA
jgi:hypothetical protein